MADAVDRGYDALKAGVARLLEASVPYARRVLRFVALPYLLASDYRAGVIRKPIWAAAADFLYIFFILRYFPDNYLMCRLWEKPRRQWRTYYGSAYEPYQRARLRRRVQRKGYGVLFDDKETSHALCKAFGLPTPRLIGVHDGRAAGLELLRETLRNNGGTRYILKPSRGAGGRGVVLAERDNDRFNFRAVDGTSGAETVTTGDRFVVEEVLVQHNDLAEVWPHSVNTLKITTYLDDRGQCHVLGAFARFGTTRILADNIALGGIGVPITVSTGRLGSPGVDKHGRLHARHTVSGVEFAGRPIPHWSRVLEICRQAQGSFRWYRFIGFDVAVTPEGPVIVEVNDAPDMVVLEAICGPVLARREILEAFHREELLISRAQLSLLATSSASPAAEISE